MRGSLVGRAQWQVTHVIVEPETAFIYAYVVSGAIESQVNDGPKRVYRAGDSWFERPGS